MNVWECEHVGCDRVAYGTGGAAGLLAIGWYFRRGPMILCPQHHPEGFNYADGQAEMYQRLIEQEAGVS